jgi:hypothetical protein
MEAVSHDWHIHERVGNLITSHPPRRLRGQKKIKEDKTMTKITKKRFETIVTYMDDEIREQVHAELAPCTETEFLKRYLELDEDFYNLLNSEFGIPLYDDIEVVKFSQTVYKAEFNKANYDRIELRIPKGKKAEWTAKAKAEGMSLTAWITKQVEK